jgi:hypothetical protein
MKLSFKEKVRFERSILRDVNQARAWPAPLLGLSESAISLWASKVGLAIDDSLPLCLQEISMRCRIESDKSREVFEDGYLRDAMTLERARIALQKVIGELRVQAFVRGNN